MLGNKIYVLEIVKGLDIGGVFGGAERFGADLSITFVKKGLPVQLCAIYRTNSSEEDKWCQILNDSYITVSFLSNWKGKNDVSEFMRAVYNFQKAINLANIDVFHSHTQHGTLLALLWGKKNKKKVVRTAHVVGFEWENSIKARIARNLFGDWVFPLFVDTHVAVSKATYQYIQKYKGMRIKKCFPVLIYNAISLPRVDVSLEKCYDKPQGETYTIGTLARLHQQKGITYLIEAASIVRKKIPNIKFLVAGDGDLRDSLQKQIEQMGLSDIFFLVGKTTNQYEFLSQLDVFVLPSLWEGLPTVLLESMAAGVPIVATNIPGTNELIEDGVNGWLVPPGHSEELANKIIEALYSPHIIQKFVKNNFEKVKQFSIDKIADQYIVLFEKIISNRQ